MSSDPAPFDGKRFRNLDGPRRQGFWAFLKWRRTAQRGAWPARVSNAHQDEPLPAVGAGRVAVTFVNHATFLIRTPRATVLTDPVWAERASPVTWAGPRRVRPPGVSLARIPTVNVVLLSHNHYDHMDLATLRLLAKRDRPLILTGVGNAAYLRARGVPGAADMDWWDARELPSLGLRATFVPARHFSARGLFDRDQTLWGGFHLSADTGDDTGAGAARTLYFAGDTAAGAHTQLIRERLGPPDVALLPIGAYEPRWFMSEVHMDPAQAVAAHRALGARLSLAMHYGTFRMADEAYDAPLAELASALARHGIDPEKFRALEPGQSVVA